MYGTLVEVSNPKTAAEVIANAVAVRRRLGRVESEARFAISLLRAREIAASVAKYERKKIEREERKRALKQADIDRKLRAAKMAYDKIVAAAAKFYDPRDTETPRSRRRCYAYPVGPSFNSDDIIDFVARAFLIDRREILGPWRSYVPVRARQCAMWLMRRRTFMSLPEIGKRIGGRDHTTIVHGLNAMKREISKHSLDGLSDIAVVRALGVITTAWVRK